ncbi:uncharacterized protein [Nicotiana sylvestris]|uniref:uncharacterized protein n=1 Tax=Nicotiana sylvestris TaxID=4096 RepID=UPI00388C827B
MPATTIEPDEMASKMKSLEQNIKNIQGLGGHKIVSFCDLCMFPHIHLPRGFKTPKFEKYDGHGDPIAHLKRYYNQLRGAGGKEELLMAYFGENLVGVASEWFIDQDISHWHVWDDMAQAFTKQFQYNINIAPDRNSLSNMNKKLTESFRNYAIKWREQTARVKPPMDNHELITVFLEAQEPDYFQNMMFAMGRPFAEAIKIGEMVENGLKTGRIVSQAALKATTQAIQNGSGSFANRKKRDEGAPRHSTDDCWTLKGAIERLISEKLIVVTNGEDPPNVTNNLLPQHNDVHFVGMIGRDQEYKPVDQTEMTVGAIQEGTSLEVRPSRDVPLIVKGAPNSEKAEEFLKKMKAQDYSIIDHLRKTPAQISLLSLIIHSKEHARVLIKVLNEAHISEETTVNQLEKMANRFFEVNRISFTDDELPEEGAGHNRALNLMVKCEGHYVKRVMVDGGSSVDVCHLSTLQSMKINTDRIRPRNVRIRAFDGSARDTMGEINLTMTIAPVDFEIVFQVVDMVTSYNFLLGRPWIHTARAAKEGSESIVYQALEVVVVDHVEEGKPILHPRLSATSVMVATVMIKQGYEPGKGLGASLQGISEPISPLGNRGTFGLGFRPTQADKNKSKHRKKSGWVLQQPIPHIFYTFVKPRLREG